MYENQNALFFFFFEAKLVCSQVNYSFRFILHFKRYFMIYYLTEVRSRGDGGQLSGFLLKMIFSGKITVIGCQLKKGIITHSFAHIQTKVRCSRLYDC